MKEIDFEDISYLMKGNQRQKAAYDVLVENFIFEQLLEFDPILVGTIPLGIDIETSDLDIVCCYSDHDRFFRGITYCFENFDHFQIRDDETKGNIVVRFTIDNFDIEIFADKIPTREQAGYRHMIVEFQILLRFGEDFRKKIIELKNEGLKTEPAFATLLGLKGDPYEALLKYNINESAIRI
jgi:hypothetical protein